MFKIFRKNCCGLNVHKTWIYACIGIADANSHTKYFQARFSSFSKGLQELALWLDKYHCRKVCMKSAGKYWIPVFNILEKPIWLHWHTPSTQSRRRATKLTGRTQSGSATCSCATWSSRPLSRRQPFAICATSFVTVSSSRIC